MLKRTNVFSLGLCFLCITFSVFAQDYRNFELNNYYTPDITRRSMEFGGSGIQNFSNSVYQSSGEVNGNFGANFRSYTNTRKLIKDLSLGFSLYGGGKSEERFYEKYLTKSGAFNNYDFVNLSYQFFNQRNFFLSVGTQLYFSTQKSSSGKTDSLNRKDNYKSNNISALGNFWVGAGLGRIESVTDAIQALYLVEMFHKNGNLKRNISQDEIFRLSQEISKVKNKRFFDSRLKLIEEITKVDSFFVTNGIIEKQDASYFTTLYDIWMNGANFERKTGQKIEFRINPNFSLGNSYDKAIYDIANEQDYEIKSNNINQNHQLGIYYTKEKCLGTQWQESFNTQITGVILGTESKSINQFNSYENSTNRASKSLNLGLSYKLGLYPNTRTNVFAQITNELNYQFYATFKEDNNELTDKSKNIYNTTELSLGIYYYISPQIRLSSSAMVKNFFDINNFTENTYQRNRFSNNFSVGISYLLF